MVEGIVDTQALLEVEIRDSTKLFCERVALVATLTIDKEKALRQYEIKFNDAMARMTKADGAEDQRKAKAQEAAAVPLARLFAARAELCEAQAALDCARAKVQMYQSIVSLIAVKL